MQSIVMNLPDDLAASIEMTSEELTSQVRLMAAFKMFDLGKISTGKAAELARLSKLDFIEACGHYHISMFNYKPEEVEAELRSDLDAIRESKVATVLLAGVTAENTHVEVPTAGPVGGEAW